MCKPMLNEMKAIIYFAVEIRNGHCITKFK